MAPPFICAGTFVRKAETDMTKKTKGFTLLEMMITVGLVAILSAIALPMYQGYVQTSRTGVLINNISTIELFQEDFRLRNGAYLLAAVNIAAITAGIGWQPQTTDGVTYVIADGGGGSYDVTATDTQGLAVCMRYPQKTRC